MTYGTATLTGTYHRPGPTAGLPDKGYVEVIPNTRTLIDPVANVIMSGPIEAKLENDGHFSVVVPATDDPALEPSTGRQYTIRAHLRYGDPTSITGVELATGSTTDVADLAPSPPTAAQVSALPAYLNAAALSATYVGFGDDLAGFTAGLPAGAEYVYNLTDGAGTLLDIVSGVK